MNTSIQKLVRFLTGEEAPKNNKKTVLESVVKNFELTQDRTVFYCDYFAVRFCYSKNNSFNNTVLSLSHLQKYDRIPVIIVLIRHHDGNQLFLANSTFLKKISHSSKELSMTNIKGSFNGSDIIKSFNNISNSAENIENLFAFHQEIEWRDNLNRLIETTKKIIPSSKKFIPTQEQQKNIFNSVKRAELFVQSKNFLTLKNDLDKRVELFKESIMVASHIENVNIRGRLIECIITSNEEKKDNLIKNLNEMESSLPCYDTKNGLGDFIRTFDNGDTYTDIKTKLVYLNSNPKAFNVDKFLSCMAEKNTIFLFYFIGIDEHSIINKILCSVYHKELIDCYAIQQHWSGRSTRGTTQIIGEKINNLLECSCFVNEIDQYSATDFIDSMLQL